VAYHADPPGGPTVGDYDVALTPEFFRALGTHGGLTLHLDLLRGRNAHHCVEAVFKAAARALGEATALDPRVRDVPSTKGVLPGGGGRGLRGVARGQRAAGRTGRGGDARAHRRSRRRAPGGARRGAGGGAFRPCAPAARGDGARRGTPRFRRRRPAAARHLPRLAAVARGERRGAGRGGAGAARGPRPPLCHGAPRAARRLGAGRRDRGGARASGAGAGAARGRGVFLPRAQLSSRRRAGRGGARRGRVRRPVRDRGGTRQRLGRAVPPREVAGGGTGAAGRVSLLGAVTELRVAFVDVYVLRGAGAGLEVLVLRRAPGGRSPGSWETVHGTIEPGETPVEAARREVREETGLEPARLYNLSRVELFYRHRADEIALIPAFAAFVEAGREARPSAEHDRAEWLAPA